MTEPLSRDDRTRLRDIYLDDHWAGAAAGLALARRLAEENADSPWGAELALIANQIDHDRQTLADIRRHLQCDGGALKKGLALVGERLSRLKPNGRIIRYSPLSRVLELEALISGVAAKQRLWVALHELDHGRGQLADFDFRELEARAVSQLESLGSVHEAAASDLFGG